MRTVATVVLEDEPEVDVLVVELEEDEPEVLELEPELELDELEEDEELDDELDDEVGLVVEDVGGFAVVGDAVVGAAVVNGQGLPLQISVISGFSQLVRPLFLKHAYHPSSP